MSKSLSRAIVIWPTAALLIFTYLAWVVGLFWLADISVVLAVMLLTPVIALHASLQHEAIHGHVFASRVVNRVILAPALALVIPYLRYEATHLAHHNDVKLTDPYDDPETAYLDPQVYHRLPGWLRGMLRVNNTLAGRILLGPLIGTAMFVTFDLRAMRLGDRDVAHGWLWYLPALVPVVWLVSLSPLPFWAYGIAAYLAMSLLKIRTFLEHQAHVHAAARSVIIEDRGVLAFLFLNNNLHVVHHMHPDVPWYALPGVYRDQPERYLTRNGGYRYRSYAEVFRRYLLRGKEPVSHPLWPN